MGLVVPRHVGSSRTRARTHVPCIGRWILNHCATREAPLVSYCCKIFHSVHPPPLLVHFARGGHLMTFGSLLQTKLRRISSYILLCNNKQHTPTQRDTEMLGYTVCVAPVYTPTRRWFMYPINSVHCPAFWLCLFCGFIFLYCFNLLSLISRVWASLHSVVDHLGSFSFNFLFMFFAQFSTEYFGGFFYVDLQMFLMHLDVKPSLVWDIANIFSQSIICNLRP